MNLPCDDSRGQWSATCPPPCHPLERFLTAPFQGVVARAQASWHGGVAGSCGANPQVTGLGSHRSGRASKRYRARSRGGISSCHRRTLQTVGAWAARQSQTTTPAGAPLIGAGGRTLPPALGRGHRPSAGSGPPQTPAAAAGQT